MQLKYVFAGPSRTPEVIENLSHYTYEQEQEVLLVVEEDCLHAADIYLRARLNRLCVSRHSSCQC